MRAKIKNHINCNNALGLTLNAKTKLKEIIVNVVGWSFLYAPDPLCSRSGNPTNRTSSILNSNFFPQRSDFTASRLVRMVSAYLELKEEKTLQITLPEH
jgi:hypothetical protein